MTNAFIVHYQVLDYRNEIIKEGKMRCKNKLSEFEAQCSLEEHLKKTVKGFSKMVVVKCHADNILAEMLTDFLKSNPFTK